MTQQADSEGNLSPHSWTMDRGDPMQRHQTLRQAATRWMVACLLACTVGAAAMAPPAYAATVTQLMNNGSIANRVDLVILGDGYRQSEMSKFATDAQNFLDAFFAETPFKEYEQYFNAWRIDTPSKTSGASSNGSPGNTVYGAHFSCFGVDRLLCIVNERVAAVLDANLAAAQQDMVIVIVNDDRYGGSGGIYAAVSTHPDAGEIALHEIGHSFGFLEDEYVDLQLCEQNGDATDLNVTKSTKRKSIPWTRWIPKSTPIPTPEDDGVGLYEGAFYCTNDWYRPTFDSKMRALDRPFEEVNGEQLIRRVYELTSSIDSRKPSAGTVSIPNGRSRVFLVNVVDADKYEIVWRLDGTIISQKAKVKVSAASLNGQTRELVVSVRDKTNMVRNDPDNLLLDEATWNVSPGP